MQTMVLPLLNEYFFVYEISFEIEEVHVENRVSSDLKNGNGDQNDPNLNFLVLLRISVITFLYSLSSSAHTFSKNPFMTFG